MENTPRYFNDIIKSQIYCTHKIPPQGHQQILDLTEVSVRMFILSYRPTQYERPLALWTGDTSGAVTAHSYQTLLGPTHRQKWSSNAEPAGT